MDTENGYRYDYADVPPAIRSHIKKFYGVAAMFASCFIIVAVAGAGMSIEFILTGILISGILIGMGLAVRHNVLTHGYVMYMGICTLDMGRHGIGNGRTHTYAVDVGNRLIALRISRGQAEIPSGACVAVFAPYNVREYDRNGIVHLSSMYSYTIIPAESERENIEQEMDI